MFTGKILIALLTVGTLFWPPRFFAPVGAHAGQEPQVRITTELVKVPVVVIGKDNDQLYTNLKQENFKILEDGVPQAIAGFESEQAPLTVVLLLEYSRQISYIRGEVIRPAGIFVSQLMEPRDYAAIVAFDLRPKVLADFTRNRQMLVSEVNRLVYSLPAFSESNLFDAVKFVLSGGTVDEVEYKGLAEIEGRTGVLLIATGIDTFSKLTYDQAREVVAGAGVPLYAIGIGELAYLRAEPYLSGPQRLTFLQAQNTLRTLAQESGGRFYNVRFQGALDSVLESIAARLRFQYTLYYSPSAPRQPGGKHKIEVLVDVNGDGRPDNDDLELQYRRSYVKPGPALSRRKR
jgi:Ca-activated chloride channel family protein